MSNSKWLPVLGLIMLTTACTSVQTEKNDETHYTLQAHYSDPPRNMDSYAMRKQSKEVCPQGYEILTKSAEKSGPLGRDDAQCATSEKCDYTLQWRIVCVDKPEQPFSIFGSK